MCLGLSVKRDAHQQTAANRLCICQRNHAMWLCDQRAIGRLFGNGMRTHDG